MVLTRRASSQQRELAGLPTCPLEGVASIAEGEEPKVDSPKEPTVVVERMDAAESDAEADCEIILEMRRERESSSEPEVLRVVDKKNSSDTKSPVVLVEPMTAVVLSRVEVPVKSGSKKIEVSSTEKSVLKPRNKAGVVKVPRTRPLMSADGWTLKKSGPPPKGRNKSGRSWKVPKIKMSMTIAVPALHPSWAKRQKQREQDTLVRDKERAMKEVKRAAAILKRERVEAHKKSKEEKTRAAEVVQVISNPAKIKRMKKKQLRRVQKRDTTKVIERMRAERMGTIRPHNMKRPST